MIHIHNKLRTMLNLINLKYLCTLIKIRLLLNAKKKLCENLNWFFTFNSFKARINFVEKNM